MTRTADTSLAPDAALPQRDELLSAAGMAERLAELLGAPLLSVTIERVKYRVGESLRVLYRVQHERGDQLVSLRTFPGERGLAELARARTRALAAGPLAPVAHDPELGAVLFAFPNDRRLKPPAETASQRVVAYSPEVRVTLRRVDAAGRPEAYLKHYAGEAGLQVAAIHAGLDRRIAASESPLRVARALGYERRSGVLTLAAVDAEPVAGAAGMLAFGEALARLHGLPAGSLDHFERLSASHLATAASIVATARPDVADSAAALCDTLARIRPPAEPGVWLHGDVHPKNCLLGADGATLIDLDQSALGPASADLGSMLARLRRDVAVGRLEADEAAARRDAFLAGYAGVRDLPPAAALAFHEACALLAESALRSVNRIYEDGLAALGELLEAALGRAEAAGV